MRSNSGKLLLRTAATGRADDDRTTRVIITHAGGGERRSLTLSAR